jgi:hypothetical protein
LPAAVLLLDSSTVSVLDLFFWLWQLYILAAAAHCCVICGIFILTSFILHDNGVKHF